MTGKSKRIWELDFWRGLAIILVVFDHAFFDFGRLFYQWRNCGVGFLEWLNALGLDYLGSDVRAFWRPAFLFLFFCWFRYRFFLWWLGGYVRFWL